MSDRGKWLQIARWLNVGTAAKSRLSRYLPVYDASVASILTCSGLPSSFPLEIRWTQMDERERATYAR
jgi:hypothetical protein